MCCFGRAGASASNFTPLPTRYPPYAPTHWPSQTGSFSQPGVPALSLSAVLHLLRPQSNPKPALHPAAGHRFSFPSSLHHHAPSEQPQKSFVWIFTSFTRSRVIVTWAFLDTEGGIFDLHRRRGRRRSTAQSWSEARP